MVQNYFLRHIQSFLYHIQYPYKYFLSKTRWDIIKAIVARNAVIRVSNDIIYIHFD